MELLGLTATLERTDGLDVLRHFDGRIAAELRLWDAVDQQYLAPFSYFGVHDGQDLRNIPWRRGQGYDVGALENVLTANDARIHLVVEEVRRKVSDPSRIRTLGSCVSVGHAQFMADRFNQLNPPAVALSAASSAEERRTGLRATPTEITRAATLREYAVCGRKSDPSMPRGGSGWHPRGRPMLADRSQFEVDPPG